MVAATVAAIFYLRYTNEPNVWLPVIIGVCVALAVTGRADINKDKDDE